MRAAIQSVLLVVLVLWPWQARVRAECVTRSMSVEQRLEEAQAVFVADVLEIDWFVKTESSSRNHVRFRVLEAFRGVKVGEQTIQFRPTAEEFSFATSQRVLVYAYGSEGSYSTACTATRVVTLDDPDVQLLERLAPQRR